MFVTSDTDLYEKVLTLSNHGRARSQKKQFWPDAIGFKYKMSNIQAAIGCAQLERIEELVNRKREILASYMIRLSALLGITMNPEYTGTINGAWMPTAVLHPSTGITREMMQQTFETANIDARVFFYPLSSLSMFEDRPQNVNAWSIPGRAINLPSYHDMSEADIDRVAVTLLDMAAGRIYHNSTALRQSV
jgi:perosamine synthetase